MTKIQSGIKVSAPATLIGLGSGTDIIALALDKPADEIVIQKGEISGIHIKTISGDKGQLSANLDENPAGFAAKLVWEYLIKEHGVDANIGIELDLRKKVAFNKGLGANEALAVVGAMAINDFFGSILSKRELLPLVARACATFSAHYSLAALSASLLGGCMVVADAASLDVRRVPVPNGIFLVLAYPTNNIAPIEKQQIFSLVTDGKTAIEQSQKLSGLFWALNRTDFELMGKSIQSPIFDNLYTTHFSYYAELKEATLSADALAFGLCHNGPAVFALCTGTISAEKCEQTINQFFKDKKIRVQTFLTGINNEGAILE